MTYLTYLPDHADPATRRHLPHVPGLLRASLPVTAPVEQRPLNHRLPPATDSSVTSPASGSTPDCTMGCTPAALAQDAPLTALTASYDLQIQMAAMFQRHIDAVLEEALRHALDGEPAHRRTLCTSSSTPRDPQEPFITAVGIQMAQSTEFRATLPSAEGGHGEKDIELLVRPGTVGDADALDESLHTAEQQLKGELTRLFQDALQRPRGSCRACACTSAMLTPTAHHACI